MSAAGMRPVLLAAILLTAATLATAGGTILSLQTLVALAWVLLRIEVYPPHGPIRTVFLLIVPLAISGVLLIFAGGLRAGTWPPGRFHSST